MAGVDSVSSAGTQGPTGIDAAGSANTKTPAASPGPAGMDSAGPDKPQAKAHPTSFDPDSVLPKEVDFVPWVPQGLVPRAEKHDKKGDTSLRQEAQSGRIQQHGGMAPDRIKPRPGPFVHRAVPLRVPFGCNVESGDALL